MTRFDAATPTERRALYREGIVAHRERAGGILTVEVDAAALGDDGPDPELGVPWIQYEGPGSETDAGDDARSARDAVAVDCTDAELEVLKELLREYSAFTIEELIRPEDATGTNVRIAAGADADRLAQLFEDVFRRVYGLPEGGRIWITTI